MSEWIDFKQLREQLDFQAVLDHYGVEVKQKGSSGQAQGFCPLPTHEGQRRSPSFSVNLDRGIFHCFGCGAKGNVLDFAARMEGLDPDSRRDIREAARMLEAHFQTGSTGQPPEPPETPEPREAPKASKDAASSKQAKRRSPPESAPQSPPAGKSREGEQAPENANTQVEPTSEAAAPENPEGDEASDHRINAPLKFALKHLDPEHSYLEARGITPETAQHFGLGYCSRGLMKERIAIPLHSLEGELVGYVGRLVDDEQIGEDSPKYRFPGTRQKEGVTYEFRKSRLLFNAHRIERPVEELIVVEGFFDCLWLAQHGYRNTVALMGTDLSDEQVTLLLKLTQPKARLWVMPDGDDPGRECGRQFIKTLAPLRFVRWACLHPDEQPTDLVPESLANQLG